MSDDLYGQLVKALYAVPPASRKRHHWVMDRAWYDKCAVIAGWNGDDPPAETMLGLPLRVRDGAGFPHLVPGAVGTTADARTLDRAADILSGLSRNPRSFRTLVLCASIRRVSANIRRGTP